MCSLSWLLSAAADMAKRGGPGVRRSGRQRSEFEAAGGVDEDRRGVQVTEALSRSLLAGSALLAGRHQ